jgi:RimJ/RimL family protein N-acetyltransferase
MRLAHEFDELGNPVGMPVHDDRTPAIPDRSRVLLGDYAVLEPLAPRHATDLWNAFSDDADGRMWTYMHAGPFGDEEEFTLWLTQLCALDQLFLYAVVEKATGTALGFASFLRVDPGSRSLEVGWVTFSPRLQRSRVGTDAMFVMMREAFALGYRRYEWKCNALNAPSIAAAHRYGFSFEGLFRQALTVKGRNRDTAWFAVIDRDWPSLESAFERWLAADNFDASGRQRLRLSELTAPCVESYWPTVTVTI